MDEFTLKSLTAKTSSQAPVFDLVAKQYFEIVT